MRYDQFVPCLFVLTAAGYTPFDRENQQQEMEAIIAGDYKFEPVEYWAQVSDTAKSFVRACLTNDPNQRPTATEALNHRWLADEKPHFVPDPLSPHGGPTDLLPQIQKRLDAKTRFRKAVWGITAMKRMSLLASTNHVSELEQRVNQYKEESEKVSFYRASVWRASSDSFAGGARRGYRCRPPPPPRGERRGKGEAQEAGRHLRRQGERLDRIAEEAQRRGEVVLDGFPRTLNCNVQMRCLNVPRYLCLCCPKSNCAIYAGTSHVSASLSCFSGSEQRVQGSALWCGL